MISTALVAGFISELKVPAHFKMRRSATSRMPEKEFDIIIIEHYQTHAGSIRLTDEAVEVWYDGNTHKMEYADPFMMEQLQAAVDRLAEHTLKEYKRRQIRERLRRHQAGSGGNGNGLGY